MKRGKKNEKIGVLGIGTMGSGIIQVLAQNGYEVVVRVRKQETIDKGIAGIAKSLDKLVAKEKISAEDRDATLARITGATELDVMKDVDLVIEAAVEDMELKKALFAELDGICKPEETRQVVVDLATKLGKTPVDVAEAPGFVVNRILIL